MATLGAYVASGALNSHPQLLAAVREQAVLVEELQEALRQSLLASDEAIFSVVFGLTPMCASILADLYAVAPLPLATHRLLDRYNLRRQLAGQDEASTHGLLRTQMHKLRRALRDVLGPAEVVGHVGSSYYLTNNAKARVRDAVAAWAGEITQPSAGAATVTTENRQSQGIAA